jgi:tellurite resistance protein TerC
VQYLAEGAPAGHVVDTAIRPLQWAVLGGFVIFALLIDRFVLNRKSRELTLKESALQTGFFVSLSVLFGLAFVLPQYGWNGLQQYYGLYVSEFSLSVDNLFVMLIILTQCGVPKELHQKALYWGINIAIVLRVGLIVGGTAILVKAEPLMLLVAGYMLYVAYDQVFGGDDEKNVTTRWSYKLINKLVPVTYRTYGSKFFIWQRAKWVATVLFVVVCIIGCVDVLFALDSIPTAIALSKILFVTIAGNVNGVLGLRPVYFLMGHLAKYIKRLNWGLCLICAAIGAKLITSDGWFMHDILGLKVIPVPISIALAWIGFSLLFAFIAGRIWPPKEATEVDKNADDKATLVSVYVDNGSVMNGEWAAGLIQEYTWQVLVEARHYDSDGQVPMYGFAQKLGEYRTARVGETLELSQLQHIGTRSHLAVALRHAKEVGESVLGTHVVVIVTAGVFADQKEARQLMAQMPDNTFVLYVRVSDEPGGAGFLGELDTMFTGDRDRCHVIYATDDAGQPKQLIVYEIGAELDGWLKERNALLVPA